MESPVFISGRRLPHNVPDTAWNTLNKVHHSIHQPLDNQPNPHKRRGSETFKLVSLSVHTRELVWLS